MANTIISQIGMNDPLEEVIRKCNDNFRRVSYAQERNSSGNLRREADRSDSYADGVVAALEEDVQARIDAVVEKINDLSNEIPRITHRTVEYKNITFDAGTPGTHALSDTERLYVQGECISCVVTRTPRGSFVIPSFTQDGEDSVHAMIAVYRSSGEAVSNETATVQLTFLE